VVSKNKNTPEEVKHQYNIAHPVTEEKRQSFVLFNQ